MPGAPRSPSVSRYRRAAVRPAPRQRLRERRFHLARQVRRPGSHGAGRKQHDAAVFGHPVERGFKRRSPGPHVLRRLTLCRRARGVPWNGIWLLPSGQRYDIVGAGITILDSRTRDAAGKTAIVFTSGHIAFRQSLLVRAGDAERIARHGDLTGDDRAGALADTTGEARLLELTGIADSAGVLAAGTRVETPHGTAVADGSADYVIDATGASRGLAGRKRVRPAASTMPMVVYHPDETSLIEALAAGGIDAVARGEIGNLAAAKVSGGAFAVTALDARAKTGGFALAAEDAALAACLDRHIGRLTDGGRISYWEWLEDPSVFMRRARQAVAGNR